MPNGPTHSTLTILTSTAIFGVSTYFGTPLSTTVALTAGCLAGLVIHPDLDYADRRRGLWYRFWWLYGRAIAHRHALSHFPIFSTLFRILYLSPIPLAVILHYDIAPTPNWFYALAGLIAADTVHYFADTITTSIKRTF